MDRLKSNKFWIFVLGGVVIISSIVALALWQVPASRAHIYQNGVLIDSIDLSSVAEPYVINIRGSDGTNVIAVERGRIRMQEAGCPDKTCVRQGWISGGVTPIICLPNRLIVRLDGGSGSDIDAVVG
jgi:hypothetical protein